MVREWMGVDGMIMTALRMDYDYGMSAQRELSFGINCIASFT